MLSNVKGKGKAIFKVISSFLASYLLAKLGFHLLKYSIPLQNFNQVSGSFLLIPLYSFM